MVTTMAVRGAFQSRMLKARARELSKLIAIQSELGATRLQDLPDGSRQAQREQLGWVCVRRGVSRSVMISGQHQPANCIEWGWLGVASQGRWREGREGAMLMPCPWQAPGDGATEQPWYVGWRVGPGHPCSARQLVKAWPWSNVR